MTNPDFRTALKQLADAVDGWEIEVATDDPLAIAMDHARKLLQTAEMDERLSSGKLVSERLDELFKEKALCVELADGTTISSPPSLVKALKCLGLDVVHGGPTPLPASEVQGEVEELIAALEADAECVAAEQPDLMQLTDKQLRRTAELLKGTPVLSAQGFQIGPQE